LLDEKLVLGDWPSLYISALDTLIVTVIGTHSSIVCRFRGCYESVDVADASLAKVRLKPSWSVMLLLLLLWTGMGMGSPSLQLIK